MIDASTVAIITVICTLLGTAFPKVIEMISGRRKVQVDEAAQLRAEAATMRKELVDIIDKLRIELGEVKDDLDDWKGRYYDLRELFADLSAAYKTVVSILRANNLGHLIETEAAATREAFEAIDSRPHRRRKTDKGNTP